MGKGEISRRRVLSLFGEDKCYAGTVHLASVHGGGAGAAVPCTHRCRNGEEWPFGALVCGEMPFCLPCHVHLDSGGTVSPRARGNSCDGGQEGTALPTARGER